MRDKTADTSSSRLVVEGMCERGVWANARLFGDSVVCYREEVWGELSGNVEGAQCAAYSIGSKNEKL